MTATTHRNVRRRLALALAVLATVLTAPALASPAAARTGDGRPGTGEAYSRPAPPRQVGAPLPVSYTGSAGQLVVVRADCRTCTSATLQAWTVTGAGWGIPITGPIRAKVGERGVGAAYEDSRLTPLGVWDLTQAFGIKSNPGTSMPYFVAGMHDYWDDRSGSPTYNMHVRDPYRPAGESLGGAGAVYDYAVVMGVNPGRVPGGGSGFFLHVTDGRPTLGCVAIPAEPLVRILRWLHPAQHPQMVVTL